MKELQPTEKLFIFNDKEKQIFHDAAKLFRDLKDRMNNSSYIMVYSKEHGKNYYEKFEMGNMAECCDEIAECCEEIADAETIANRNYRYCNITEV